MKIKLFLTGLLLLSICLLCDAQSYDELSAIRFVISEQNQVFVPDSENVSLSNPTFQEAIDFIGSDATDSNQFIDEKYECRNFAADVKNNAFKQDMICGFVILNFSEGQHTVVAFNTTDKGLIFIEPQNDRLIRVEVGGYYEDWKIEGILIVW